MLVKTLRRRFPEEVQKTNIVLIDCRNFRDPASSALRNPWGVHPTTLSKILNHHKFPGLCCVEVPPQQLDLMPGELRADQGASITDRWNHSGSAEPRIELVERRHDRERDEANALIAFLY